MIEDDELLEKHNTNCDKVTIHINKELDSEHVYNKKRFETKIKSYGGEVTNFYNKGIPKVDSNHIFLAVINLDSALKITIINKFFA